MQYNFEWDPNKAKSNFAKHGVRFEQAATVFRDPSALTIFDDKHSGEETRWITMGLSTNGVLLVVIHTFEEETKKSAVIRIISSRKATKKEQRQYLKAGV